MIRDLDYVILHTPKGGLNKHQKYIVERTRLYPHRMLYIVEGYAYAIEDVEKITKITHPEYWL